MVQVNCNCRNAGRIIYASLLLAHLIISICALGVALGYEWARVDLLQSSGCPCNCTYAPCTQNCCASKASIYLSLFDLKMEMPASNGAGSSVAQDNIYQTLGFNNSAINIKALPVVVAGSLASGVLSFICLFVTGANMCLSKKSRRYRSSAIYLLCLFSSLLSVTALAAFLDFYIWELRDGVGLLPNTNLYFFNINSVPYIQLARLDWAFYVHAGGVVFSVITFVLACGITSLEMKPPAAAPPPPQADPPPPYSAVVTVLAYDKDLGRWVIREKPKEGEKQLAIEAYKEGKDFIPKPEESVATATL